MKIGRLIAAVVVLAALGGTLYWSNHRVPVKLNAEIAASAPPMVISLKQADITKLEVQKKGEDDVVLTRLGPESWKIISPKSFYADQGTVSQMLSDLSSFDADRLIEENSRDLKPYGLTDPAVSVTATDKDGKTHTLLFGDDTPAGVGAYLKLGDDPRVFTSSVKLHFDKGLNDLRDKHLLPVDFNNLKSVEIVSPKLHLTFVSENGQWVAQDPKKFRADTTKLEDVVERLRTADMEPNTPEADMKKAASLFSSGTPVATVKVTDPSGSQELQIRKIKDDYYTKSTAMSGVYKLQNDIGNSVDKNMNDFLEKEVFDFAAETPEKIEIHDGEKAYILSRAGEDWWSNGKKMDPISVENLIRTIRGLTATKFVSSAFLNPTLNLTVVSGDGKRIEKVQIAKSGDSYIAKREDAAQLYGLDASKVDDMRKTADELKPAEAPPAKK